MIFIFFCPFPALLTIYVTFAFMLLFLNYFLHSYYFCPASTPWAHRCSKKEPWGQTSNFSSDRCWNVSAFFLPSWIPYLWSVLSVNNIITSELRSCPLKWNLKQLRHWLYHINVLECKTAAGALSGHEAQLLKSAIYLSIVVLFVLPMVCVL